MEGLDAEALGVLELEEVLEEKPEFHPLLFLSRHSEATETLMYEYFWAIDNRSTNFTQSPHKFVILAFTVPIFF